MTAASADIEQLAAQLTTFLNESGWMPRKSMRGLTFYHAPANLRIEGNYSVALPSDPNRPGTANLLHGAAKSLTELYGVGNVGELVNRAAALGDLGGPARIISRFIGEKTRNGSMPLSALGVYVQSLERTLYREAAFRLGGESKASKPVAAAFSEGCQFLQSEAGSFIAKVEIPHSTLRQSDLLGNLALTSTEVCSSLFSGIEFINERILNDDQPFENEANLSDAVSLFDVELLESMAKTVLGPSMEAIEFSLQAGSIFRSSSTGLLSNDKTDRLRNYVEFIKQQMRGESDLDVSGSIVELRSRDPEGNKNYIKVVAAFHGDRIFVAATLSNDQYKQALSAHENKRSVRIKGNGIRLKTQIRMTGVVELMT